MRRLFPLLPAALLLFSAACGEDLFGQVVADPFHFDSQRFDCDDSNDVPSCPPYTCSVDENGLVTDCEDGCAFDNFSTSFVGVDGVDLCVPPMCTVSAENTAPECEPGCADDDVTIYVFEYACR